VTDQRSDDGCPLFTVAGSAVKYSITGLLAGGVTAAGGGGGGGGGTFFLQPAAANTKTRAALKASDGLHLFMIV